MVIDESINGDELMKLAITGKGGVGKTTVASLLARLYALEGKSVLAIEANPDGNLASALGMPPEVYQKITPIAEMHDLIEERTGARPGAPAPFFRLNPKVDDIPDAFSATKDGIKLLVMGTVKQAGTGCMCPESALLRSLMQHLILQRGEVVIFDMDAGVEHLARGTAQSVDAFIIVVEPGRRSLQTADSIRRLAKDLGITKIYVIGSKVRSDEDRKFVIENMPDYEILGFLSYSQGITDADLKGASAFDVDAKAVEEIEAIKQKLESKFAQR